ncbi:hypothetical protein MO867_07650 [Microbulbifer sp. OS29]|uniref:Uncharacterized protein n=1 Tax=Microbulbifer okhotskensis TaxID=2926617 RepID=A0A9X2J789_9GAMM|nr:hypothetical protein [Microbulbifer okhotskensis]MCO1334216.1 hypothetical protein [Microbulbifer okhotskensis]
MNLIHNPLSHLDRPPPANILSELPFQALMVTLQSDGGKQQKAHLGDVISTSWI